MSENDLRQNAGTASTCSKNDDRVFQLRHQASLKGLKVEKNFNNGLDRLKRHEQAFAHVLTKSSLSDHRPPEQSKISSGKPLFLCILSYNYLIECVRTPFAEKGN